ncbi:unnamed protein product [Soboliphyme baturini]|uniref:Uncharacterized protein n=1 Tax=Soboliphyme baturini TaxID=241478 RepID=A0A183IN19_9BILA|nr:unnamed protein product [Soboliphyme baturini]
MEDNEGDEEEEAINDSEEECEEMNTLWKRSCRSWKKEKENALQMMMMIMKKEHKAKMERKKTGRQMQQQQSGGLFVASVVPHNWAFISLAPPKHSVNKLA